MNIQRRGQKGIFWLIRRVPKRYLSLPVPRVFKKSLHTDSIAEAEEKSREIWKMALMSWEAKLSGRDDDYATYHAKIVEIAEATGFGYVRPEELAEKPVISILDRIDAIDAQVSPEIADALLGAASAPTTPLSDMLEIYSDLMVEENGDKSEKQLRKWRTGIERTVGACIALVGDIPLEDFDADHAFRYKTHLADRISERDISAYTANREMYTLNRVISEVSKNRLGSENKPFTGLMFKERKSKRRNRQISFSTPWIEGVLLDPSNFERMNVEARDILWLMVNLPARPSEIVALNKSSIHLTARVPHIEIYADNRQLKSVSAERSLPLSGLSLEIMRKYPDGFVRYAGKSDNWSAMVNKYMRENDLKETDEHTAYCLRHSFADRLQNAGATEYIKNHMFGHHETGTAYGEGVWLETARDWIEKIELSVKNNPS